MELEEKKETSQDSKGTAYAALFAAESGLAKKLYTESLVVTIWKMEFVLTTLIESKFSCIEKFARAFLSFLLMGQSENVADSVQIELKSSHWPSFRFYSPELGQENKKKNQGLFVVVLRCWKFALKAKNSQIVYFPVPELLVESII